MFIQCDKILFYKLAGDILLRYIFGKFMTPFVFIYQSSMGLFTVRTLIKLDDSQS